jgi:hypothetical protein
MPGGGQQSLARHRAEMEREGGGGHTETRGDFPGRQAVWPARTQQAQQFKPRLLCQGCKHAGGLSGFHVSMIAERSIGFDDHMKKSRVMSILLKASPFDMIAEPGA